MAARGDSKGSGAGNSGGGEDQIQFVSISDETRRRYLNYAMSVIMAAVAWSYTIVCRVFPEMRTSLVLLAVVCCAHIAPFRC